MRALLFTAIVLGLLFMPVFAQAPKPEKIDTAQQAIEPEMTEEAVEAEEPMGVEAALSVKDMAFCTAVVEREPLSRDTSFSSDIGQIFFWSNVLNDGGEGSIEHVWYYNGEEKARVELPAKYSRNRVWSSKNILPEWTGEWKVAVMAGSEKLGEMTCKVE